MREPHIVVQSDLSLNDSDKTFTVPAGQRWKLQWLQAKLITTATVGNRQMRVEIGDGANLLWFKNFGTTQAASLTRQYYGSSDYGSDDGAFDAAGNIRIRMYDNILTAGYTVRVYDSAAIAATTDDLDVRLIVDARRPPAAAY